MKELAYLAGVVTSDGWVNDHIIGLTTKDLDFAEAFSDALHVVYGVKIRPKMDKRGYWQVRTSNRTGRFNALRTFEPSSDTEYAAWVRGYFDSDGNASLVPAKISVNAFSRRVAIYSTALNELGRCATYLDRLGIATAVRATKNSASHIGDKTVYELRVAVNRANFQRFSILVGSSIGRKQETLNAIPESYKPDLSAHCREVQLIGATARRQRTIETVLPQVIIAIAKLIGTGTKPTQRACYHIPGYHSVRHFKTHSELIGLAQQGV